LPANIRLGLKSMKVAKHSGLLYSYNYCRKKFYSSGTSDEENGLLNLLWDLYKKFIAFVNVVA
jgi:hypothetical protein